MKLRRATRYRVYPTATQEARLLAWESSLRWFWNLALEQRYMQLSRAVVPSTGRGPVRYRGEWFNLMGMSKQITELRKVDERLNDIPRHALALIIDRLDKAWKHYWAAPKRRPIGLRIPKSPDARMAFKERWRGHHGPPRFKRHGTSVSVGESDRKCFTVGCDCIKFPKLGKLRAVIHRRPLDRPKRCELVREGHRWFASVLHETDVAEPAPKGSPVVGIDRGVTLLIADSDGRTVPRPEWLDSINRRIARAQRKASKAQGPDRRLKRKGSVNWGKACARLSELKRLKVRKMESLLHEQSAYYAERYGVVVVEDLQIMNMTASAKGSPNNPGNNVNAKAGLNRSILESGWGKFITQLEYKLAERGGLLLKVNPAYTSQTCSQCGCVSADSRKSQAVFHCVDCGHESNADINAAINIRTAGESPAVQAVEDSGLPDRRSSKVQS
jgi:putative transposase